MPEAKPMWQHIIDDAQIEKNFGLWQNADDAQLIKIRYRVKRRRQGYLVSPQVRLTGPADCSAIN